MDVDARLEALRSEVDSLRAHITVLEHALGLTFSAPIEYRLTASEQRMLGALMRRALLTKEAALAALYTDSHRDPAEPKIVDVFICKMRKKLTPFGIEIATAWGQGYRLTPESKSLIADRVAELAA